MRAAGRTVAVGAAALLIAGVSLPAGGGHEAWVARFETVPVAGGSPRAMLVSADGGMVFVMGEADGVDVTVAYDAASGREVWRRPFDEAPRQLFEGRIRASTILLDPSGSRLIVAGWRPGMFPQEGYAAVAYDAGTGERLWDVQYAAADDALPLDWMRVALAPDGGTVFVSGGGWVGAYEAATGLEIWRFRRPPADRLTVAPDGGAIYLAGRLWDETGRTPDAVIVARAAGTGAVEWTAVAEGWHGDLAVSPDGSRIIVSSARRPAPNVPIEPVVVAFDSGDGGLRWEVAGGPMWAFGAAPDGPPLLFLGAKGDDQGVPVTRAHDVATGAIVWEALSGMGGRLLVGPEGARLYRVGDRRETAYDERTAEALLTAYDARTGDILWEVEEPFRWFPPGPYIASTSSFHAAVVSPDGKRLYMTFQDWGGPMPPRSYPIIGYNTHTGEQVWYTWFRGLRYPGYNAEPRILAMAPDSLTLFVAGENYMHGSLVSGRSVSQGVTVAYDLVKPVPCPGVVSEIAHEAEEPAGPYRGEVRDLNCQHVAPLDPWR